MSKINLKKGAATNTSRAQLESVTNRKSQAGIGTRDALIFSKENYKWTGIALVLIFIGLLLMSGGSMPNPETWDPNIIYSARRTVLAPIFILGGLGVQIYAIFK